MKKIAFIIPPYISSTELSQEKLRCFLIYPYGVLSIATYIQNNINDTEIKIFDYNINNNNIINDLELFQPYIIGISMMFDISYKYISNIIDDIKLVSTAAIIMGGSAVTSSYKEIINTLNIDAICYSEGEIPFLNLIKSNNINETFENDPSWITKNNVDKKIPTNQYLTNLNEVININYNLININDYEIREAFSPFKSQVNNKKQFFIITSRGCAFKCTFCMRSADTDRSIRYANVNKLLDHVDMLVNQYGMNVLTIYDDQILFNKNRAKEFFRGLAKYNIRVECPNGLSVAYIDDEMAMLMKNAGMDTTYLAIESGSSYVLNKLIHKPLNIKMIKPVVNILRKYGFWIQGYFVIGFPGETDIHRQETLDLINNIQLDWSGFSLAFPTRGSILHKICIDNNYIDKELPIGTTHMTKFIINTPEYSSEYVSKKTYLMNLDVNFVNNYRLKIGDYKTAYNVFLEVTKRYQNHAFAYYFLYKISLILNLEYKLYLIKIKNIIETENIWLEYFNYFNINIEKEINAY